MSTRTDVGNLVITDTFNQFHKLVIQPNTVTISLKAVDQERGELAVISLGTAELDALAAEILILRDQLDI
jgi:hypothetical protein